MARAVLCLLLGICSLRQGYGDEFLKPIVDIVGGNQTDIRHHPYQVSVWSGSQFLGSGAMLEDHWVITTALAVTGFDTASLTVRAHSSSAMAGGRVCRVRRVLVHPGFRIDQLTHDVALLMVQGGQSQQQRIALARRSLPVDTVALLSGWGATSNTSKMADRLQQAWARPVELTQCQSSHTLLTPGQLCVSAVNVFGPCWGDRGDLLVYRRRLYALLSWTPGCFSVPQPSVFTDLSKVRWWVNHTIKSFKTSTSKVKSNLIY